MLNNYLDVTGMQIANLIKEFNRCAIKTVMDFDLLQSAYSNLNENAHTRILAALLKIDVVCKSFFVFLDRCYPGREIDRIVGINQRTAQRPTVHCFENYMDALVVIGDYRVIIENKVNGAKDRPEQIDRYVQTVLNQGVKPEKIFVLYLTRSGGSPSKNSLDSARNFLDCTDSSNGRFFSLSYSVDILSWLNEMLAGHIELKLAEDVREVFLSGVVQYRHYLQGAAVLSIRRDGGEAEFREYALSEHGSVLADICVTVEFERLFRRQCAVRALRDLSVEDDRPEERQILKLLFYREFNRLISDEDFYQVIESTDGNLLTSMGMWEESSLVQVDVWCKSETSSDSGIKELIETVEKNVHLVSLSNVGMKYNSHDMVRFRINTVGDLELVLDILRNQFNIATHDSNNALQGKSFNDGGILKGCIDSCRFVNWMKSTFSSSAQSMVRSEKRVMWNQIKNADMIATHNYWYVNRWAIQLYENPDDPVRAFDVFGNTGTSEDDLMCLQDAILNCEKIYPFCCMRWYGQRLFMRFPLPTEDYAKELLRVLWQWRENQTTSMHN